MRVLPVTALRPSWIVPALGLAALAACGGGGGGGGNDPQPVLLSTNNAGAAADDCVATGVGILTTQTISTFGVPSSPGVYFLPRVIADAMEDLFADLAPMPGGSVESCPDGGTVTATHVDADLDGEPSAGDQLRFVFEGCADGDVVVDGSISFVINAFSEPTPGVWSTNVSATVDLQFRVAILTYHVDLVASVVADRDAEGTVTMRLVFSDLELRGPRRSLSSAEPITTDATVEDDGDYTVSTTGAVESSRLGGTVSWTTQATFVGVGHGWPSQGVLLIEGAGESTIRLTAIDSSTAQIEIDADGNGTFETTFTRPWNALVQ
jgi:hypothetical protein